MEKRLLEEYEGIIEKIEGSQVTFHFVNIESLFGRTGVVNLEKFGIADLKEGDKIRCREYSGGTWEFERNTRPDISDEYWEIARGRYNQKNLKP